MLNVKILHVITGLATGGAEKQLLHLAIELKRKGFDQTIVSLIDLGATGQLMRDAGLDVRALRMAIGPSVFIAFARLVAIIKSVRPDILQTWLYHADVVGLLAARITGVPRLAWNLRCSNMDLGHYRYTTRAVLRSLIPLSTYPDLVICNSEAGRHWHETLGYRPKRWAHIPNGIDEREFSSDAAKRATFRRVIGVADDLPLFGMVARVDPMKDHDNFLAAIEIVARADPHAHFVFVGSGTDNKRWRRRAQSTLPGRIHCLGPWTDISTVMNGLDALVLPSAFGEGFSNVIGEAMSCGKLCIATDVGDAGLLVGETGWIVPPRDPESLASAMLAFLVTPQAEKEARSRAATLHVRRNFSIERMADRYDRLYREIIALPPSRAET